MCAPSDSAITIGSRVLAVPRSIQGWMMCSRSCSRRSAVSYLKFVSMVARYPLHTPQGRPTGRPCGRTRWFGRRLRPRLYGLEHLLEIVEPRIVAAEQAVLQVLLGV